MKNVGKEFYFWYFTQKWIFFISIFEVEKQDVGNERKYRIRPHFFSSFLSPVKGISSTCNLSVGRVRSTSINLRSPNRYIVVNSECHLDFCLARDGSER